ncbi:hypothetical protein AAF712_005158 [Marasmius tenuissimus]|uniref:AAA-ATPase-like domain-containing protein n=1 Tax=Marasmius tenuissimus TaxID=585030 RepID=A0ABR3A2A1_9AGAR
MSLTTSSEIPSLGVEEFKYRSGCCVMTLDFADLNVLDDRFNFSGTLNDQMKQVVDRYASKLGLGDEAARVHLIDEESAVKTLNNIVEVIAEHSQRLVVCIDNYDKPFWDVEYTPVSSSLIQKNTEFSSKLESFLGTLFIMNHGRFVPLVFFAGDSNIFPTFSNYRGHVYDIIYRTKFAIVEMVGFNQEDLQRVAEHLDNDFHCLNLR